MHFRPVIWWPLYSQYLANTGRRNLCFVQMRKSEEEISFYYWHCYAEKRVTEKASGRFSDHLIFPGKKKAINEREIKN